MGSVPHDALRRKLRAARVSRPPLRNAEYVRDLFCRLAEERLRRTLRGPVSVAATRCAVEKLSVALESGGTDETAPLLNLLETRSRAFGGAVTIAPALLNRLIGAMVGDGGDDDEPEDDDDAGRAPRAPTSIDMAFAEAFVSDVIESFEAAVVGGSAAGRGALRFAGFAAKASELTAQPDTADVLAFHMTLRFGDGGREWAFRLLIALGALDAYQAMEKAEAALRPPAEISAPDAAIWTATMRAAAQAAEYRLIGVLHEMTLTVGEIEALAPGAVIPLPRGQRMEIELRMDGPEGVAGAPGVAAGALGAEGDRRAVRIAAPPDPAFIDQVRPFAFGGA